MKLLGILIASLLLFIGCAKPGYVAVPLSHKTLVVMKVDAQGNTWAWIPIRLDNPEIKDETEFNEWLADKYKIYLKSFIELNCKRFFNKLEVY